MIRLTINFIVSVIIGSLLVSILSTQIVLASVSEFGIAVDISTRLSSTYKDILGFGPTVLGITFVAYLVFFTINHLLAKLIGNKGNWVYLLGSVAIPSVLIIMNSIFGITVVASTNSLAGWFFNVLASFCGSLYFYQQSK